MQFPVIAPLVTDMLAEIHASCPNTKDKEALVLHALHWKIAADQYFQAMFEMAAVTDLQIKDAVDRIRMLVGPAFYPGKTAEIFPFPESPETSSPATPAEPAL